jgi:hypothetical protein
VLGPSDVLAIDLMSIQAGVEDADPAVSAFSARSAQRARATDLSTAPSAPGASWGVMVSRSAVTGWLSLTRVESMAGVIRGRRHTTTIRDESLAARARDLVDRNFTATGPNQLWVADFTPVECARSRGTVKRSQLADAADHGWCASHSRYSWGFRLHGIFSSDGTPSPRRARLAQARRARGGLGVLARCWRGGGETLVGDKGYAGRACAHAVSELGATIVRPCRKNEPRHKAHPAPIRQAHPSRSSPTCKDLLTLERHGARTLSGIKERIAQRFLCLAACICLNHQRGRPSRALVDFVA